MGPPPSVSSPALAVIDPPSPARLPSPWLLIAVPMAEALMVAALPILWAMLALPDELQAVRQNSQHFTGAAFGVASLTLIPLAWWLTRPYARTREALRRGARSSSIPAADVRRSLQLPTRLARLTLAGWAAVAVTRPFFLPADTPFGDRSWDVATLVAAILCLGYLTAVLTFYGVEALTRWRIAPLLLSGGSVRVAGAFRSVRVFHHVALLILTLGVVQPLLMYCFTQWDAADRSVTVALVTAFLLLVGVVQAVYTVAALSRPAGHLVEQMSLVEGGDLNVAARVGGLDTFGRIASSFNHMVEGLRQRDRIRETFGRYVTQQVAEEILKGEVALGGERRVATVLFSDIRGFTSMSELMSPEEVVEFLNEYLDMMVDCVLDAGGTLDKFIGDAVMAVFGVPVSRGEAADAQAAVRCALEMSARLDELNAQRRAAGAPSIEIGIGVHTGPLVAGNIGSHKRMEYTVIGDTVNVTSRLEGLTKALGRRIVISDATATHLDEGFGPRELEELDEIAVKGRGQKIRIFEVRAA